MPFCYICSKSFSRPDSVKRHIDTMHHDAVLKEMPLEKVIDSAHTKTEPIPNQEKIENNIQRQAYDDYYSSEKEPKGTKSVEDLANSSCADSKTFQFKHPFTMIVAGPTSCGKTTWLTSLLQKSQTAIAPPPRKIFWFYRPGNPCIRS